jgi:hypothetical protein
MIQNNKKFFSVYAVWVAVHSYLFLSGGATKIFLSMGAYYRFYKDASGIFFPAPHRYYNRWFSKEYYDHTELFIYSVVPLLLFFLYKAFIEKKK